MRRSWLTAALAIALPAVAEESAVPPAPPDPELLVFLGETGGEDADLIFYLDTRAARKALKEADETAPEEESHE